jgi:serine/threonine-protein kinase
MASLVGQKINSRYQVIDSIGRGGMADVYKVWDSVRNTHLAMKVLREDIGQDQVFLRRFQREAQTLAKLQHQNIVRLYGLERSDSLVFMLMDLVEGYSLKEEIFRANGPLSGRRIQQVMQPVCAALHYAHQMGVVHCDIKPGNILIDHEGKVFLTDFGIARGLDTATSTMVGIGTPAYMAPELVRGEDPTPQADIYALGIVLYEMLTGGERPFTGERATITGTTAEKVRWEQINLSPVLSSQIDTVITRCLAKDRVHRYPDVEAFYLTAKETGIVDLPITAASPKQESMPATITPRAIPNVSNKANYVPWMIAAGVIVFIMIIFTLGNRGSQPINASHSDDNSSSSVASSSENISTATVKAINAQATNPPTVQSTKTPRPTTAQAANFSCSGAPKTRMGVDIKGRVTYTDGTPLRLRREPFLALQTNYIRDLSEGTRFTIIDGPVCEDGYVWWKIRTNNDHIGWSAEGDYDDYFMEPYDW